MFKYCPSCASQKITFNGRSFFCPDCGFTYFHNTAAASGCVIEIDGRIVLLVRAREPSLGKLDLPGGFVDPGEGIIEGLARELREELGWEPPVPAGSSPPAIFRLFASFPNRYPYKNIMYNTCDVFFAIDVPGLTEKDFRLETAEISGIHFLKPEEINPDDLAFESTRRAMAAYREWKAGEV